MPKNWIFIVLDGFAIGLSQSRTFIKIVNFNIYRRFWLLGHTTLRLYGAIHKYSFVWNKISQVDKLFVGASILQVEFACAGKDEDEHDFYHRDLVEYFNHRQSLSTWEYGLW